MTTINLEKIVYKRLEDGEYTLIPKAWTLKTTPKQEDYISLTTNIKGTNRDITINLFTKGLDITAVNVSEHLNLPETSLVDILDAMIDQELPAYHETANVNGKTYYNWYICSKPAVESLDEEAF